MTDTRVLAEEMIDEGLDSQRFCLNYVSEADTPDGFFRLQDQLRDDLEKIFNLCFDASQFFFPAELICSQRILVEISDEILGISLIDILTRYTAEQARGYCVVIAVYRGFDRGSNYLGRFIVNTKETVVERSLEKFWYDKVNTGCI